MHYTLTTWLETVAAVGVGVFLAQVLAGLLRR